MLPPSAVASGVVAAMDLWLRAHPEIAGRIRARLRGAFDRRFARTAGDAAPRSGPLPTRVRPRMEQSAMEMYQ